MKLFSWFAKKEPEPEAPPQIVSSEYLSYETGSLQDCGRREYQEDAFAFVNDNSVQGIQSKGLLALVADGMGGMAGGDVASSTAIASITEDFRWLEPEQDIAQWFADAVQTATGKIYEALSGRGGSTLVAGLFYQEKLWVTSVGDSFVYLLRNGVLTRLNRSQTVGTRRRGQSIDAGVPLSRTVDTDREAAAVTHFLGLDHIDPIDQFHAPLPLLPGDVVLLCSDGVAGQLSERELIQCLRQDSVKEMCEALRQFVVSKNDMYQDNYTALVIRCDY